jgi:membrane-bound lytic murein transglycosylase B
MFYHDGTLFQAHENPMRRLVCVLSLFPLIYGCSSTPAPKPVVKPQPNSAFINQTPPSNPSTGR